MVEHYHLKLSEWMLFFHKLKAGHFGSFYGAVDGMKIGEALLKFVQWRNKELDRIRQEQENQAKAAEREEHDRRVREFRESGELERMKADLAAKFAQKKPAEATK